MSSEPIDIRLRCRIMRISPYRRAADRSKSRTSRGFKKVFHRANVAPGAAVVSARLHPCRFHSRSQPSRHRPRRPTSRRIVRQAARDVWALLLARIYEGLVAIALLAAWAYSSVSRSPDPDCHACHRLCLTARCRLPPSPARAHAALSHSAEPTCHLAGVLE